MDFPPAEDSVLPGYIDAHDRLHLTAYQSLHVEVSGIQEQANLFGDRIDDDAHAALTQLLNERFFEESNGKIRRFAGISGPAYRSDEVRRDEPTEYVHLDSYDTLLHGMTLIEVEEDDGTRHYEAAFIAEDVETSDVYYFSFWTVDTLHYSESSPISETMMTSLDSMALRYETLQSIAMNHTTPIGRLQMLSAEVFRAEHSLQHLIHGDDDDAYDVHTDFYYVIPDEMTEDQIDLSVFNSRFGIDEASLEDQTKASNHTITGTFSGVSYPVLVQPNLVDDSGKPTATIDIDPYEPCALFRDDEMGVTYAVPRSQLRDVY